MTDGKPKIQTSIWYSHIGKPISICFVIAKAFQVLSSYLDFVKCKSF